MKKYTLFLILSMLVILLCGCCIPNSVHNSSANSSDSISSKKESQTNTLEEYEEPAGNILLTKISSKELKDIPKNTSYGEIINILGVGADFYNGYLSLYELDNEKILALNFKSIEEICPFSGEELILQAVKPKTKESLFLDEDDEEMMHIYGIIVFHDPYAAVYSPITKQYYEVNLSKCENIKFSNGTVAAAKDINFYDELIITCSDITESMPPQITKPDSITILN